MKRKLFLQQAGVLLAAASWPWSQLKAAGEQSAKAFVHPPYLKQGSVVGITCPAGYITEKEILPAVQQIESWGFRVTVGKTVGLREGSFAGSDEERLNDLQHMLDNRNLDAILCARGGYGLVRLIDQLDFTAFCRHPKWIIGFSDITVLHSHLQRHCRIASLHSKMCNSFPEIWTLAEPVQVNTILSIRRALSGEQMTYSAPANAFNRPGKAVGLLAGGNLKTLETLSGTASDLPVEGKILFVEDTGEYLYSIDRMFWNLKRTGKLRHLKGLIIGGFNIKPDEPGEAFGKNLYDIVLEKVKSYAYPVCFDFPVGHQKNNMALKCGMRHRLNVAPDTTTLTEIR